MARKKVILQRIANDANRRAAFKKRRQGLIKKASELATLCGVDACVVVYGEGERQATEVWPTPAAVAVVLERFKAMPELDQYKKMTDLEGWFRQRIAKLQEQVDKAKRENHEREAALLLHDVITGRRCLDGLTIEQITSLGWMVDARLKRVNDRLKQLGEQPIPPAPAPLPPPLPVASAAALPDDATAGHMVLEAPIQQEGWLMDVGVYGGFGDGSGTNSGAGAGAGGDMMQLGNSTGAEFAWGPENGPL
ncbi:hypothetical protein GUJ93_ZPchr0013g35275 [Zizania palustris]|uniref:MADS-box domain-containing protein n=1 Tax=Zizania palustris TaxID=103762 RepID=A0A8J6BZM2_ZIZPA|nr:hypothetical protein GUJ93_ZPchr0013g35275 [Zizania palustris]